MALYKNDNSKKKNYILWELHEIRDKIDKNFRLVDEMNRSARTIIKKYNLKDGKKSKIRSKTII